MIEKYNDFLGPTYPYNVINPMLLTDLLVHDLTTVQETQMNK